MAEIPIFPTIPQRCGVHNLIAYPDSEYPDQWIGAEVTGQQGESK
jgi:hypothetical protein